MAGMNREFDRQINHKTMRVIIGAIAILLAPITLIFADVSYAINSVSATYWTNSGDLFVGSLIIVGFFLASYNGASGHRDTEFYISKAAAIFALGVALFPTKGVHIEHVEPSWTIKLTENIGIAPIHIHFMSAVLLFTCLIVLMFFFSKRAARKGKQTRSLFYKFNAVLMVVGMIGAGVFGEFVLHSDETILIVEWIGLTLFGLGWLVAGSYKNDNNPLSQT
ncbi:hypothetical protein [Pseudoalteromonas sp. T1lg23B]|uniref:hypothetical protein n=1 Tax=Pseudoalteromonas sp. T1lg23B TaxID=2077097 RepID=UPI000CF60FB6|nr:hypothetical protein [Pseudoalteromonas sp. T1lg23B]